MYVGVQVKAANILDIPVIVTEQYPKGKLSLCSEIFAYYELCPWGLVGMT